MKVKKAGKRHPLLIYKRTMNRLWGATVLLGLILIVVWGAIRIQNVAVLEVFIPRIHWRQEAVLLKN